MVAGKTIASGTPAMLTFPHVAQNSKRGTDRISDVTTQDDHRHANRCDPDVGAVVKHVDEVAELEKAVIQRNRPTQKTRKMRQKALSPADSATE